MARRRSINRLHHDLAARILRHLHEEQVAAGAQMVEADLCKHFSVSRTPIRGALRILAQRRILETREKRGYFLRRSARSLNDLEAEEPRDESDQVLFVAIARDRLGGKIPDHCTQSWLARRYKVPVARIIKVLRQMADLGVVERRAGHGWTFAPLMDSEQAQVESYDLRLLIEPAIILAPGFKLDKEWAARTRERHEHFLRTPWRASMTVEFYEVNAEFHEGLARASQNRYLLQIMQQQNRLRRFMNYAWTFDHERVAQTVTEHMEVLKALERGENRIAAVLMTRHLENAR